MGKKDKALVLAMAAAPDSDYGGAKKDVDVTYAANSTATTTHSVIRTEDSTVLGRDGGGGDLNEKSP